MFRDRWLAAGVIGSVLACVACLTPVAAIVLAAVGLAAWISAVDLVAVPALLAFVLLVGYRALSARRKTS